MVKFLKVDGKSGKVKFKERKFPLKRVTFINVSKVFLGHLNLVPNLFDILDYFVYWVRFTRGLFCLDMFNFFVSL